ncbi:MAG TPA: DUF58 domain-containing protein [Candidatus Acidoferrales bacterium]|nr:DUF58 domain-containing protein [Candidatus Acidoferrales bacterium]
MRRLFPALWLSPRGVWVLLGLAALTAIASVVAWLGIVVYFGCAALIAALLADVRLGPSSKTLRVTRQPLEPLALRRPGRVVYTVENRSASAVRVGLFETPLAAIDFDRESVIGTIPAHAQATLHQGLLARERGLVHFGTIYAWAENGLGLLRRRFAIPAAAEARVFPDLSAVEGYGTLARRKTLLEQGLRRLRLRGVGSEFESIREYATGDAFRSIDWKASARRGRLMVQQYEIERSQHVIVVLDCGRIMTPRIGPQRKFDYALTAGLSVARVAQAADDNVGLLAFGAKPVLSIAPRRGEAHIAALARASYDLQPRMEEPDYERLFTELKNRNSKRSLIVFFTDIFDPVTSASVLAGLARLVRRHVVLCVLMNDAAIASALASEPVTADDAYRASVAMRLADERATAIAQLRALGIIVVDVPAAQLTVALLDAYLEVKARGKI